MSPRIIYTSAKSALFDIVTRIPRIKSVRKRKKINARLFSAFIIAKSFNAPIVGSRIILN